jgi:hypothetical protein
MAKRASLSSRMRLSAMPPEETVRIHTYQDAAAWDAAQGRGYLTGEETPRDDLWESVWERPYEWMRSMMKQRIGQFSGDLPVWAFLERQNPRSQRWIRGKVRITALVPRGRILLSDYDAWHLPLSRSPVTLRGEEWDRLHADGDPDETTMMATWPLVLEIVRPEGFDWRWIGDVDRLQACVDRITLDEIVSVVHIPSGTRGSRSKAG